MTGWLRIALRESGLEVPAGAVEALERARADLVRAEATLERAYEINDHLNRRRAEEARREVSRARTVVRYWESVVNTGTPPVRRFTGRCPVSGCPERTSALVPKIVSQRRVIDGPPPHRECPRHHRPMQWGAIAGVHNANVPCDRRCTSAKGRRCECSCGGMNHGMDLG
jgi:hypothetical protein